jgi:hypothetical protein
MGSRSEARRHRVLVPQALGSDEFLRITWHESRDLVVFSQWSGDQCTAAIPVRVSQLNEATTLLIDAVGLSEAVATTAWPPPSVDELVVPAAGLSIPVSRRSA